MSELEQEHKQNNEIELEKGWIPFEELCPIWASNVRNGKRTQYDLGKHQTCIVGEAHGFKPYNGGGYDCDECENFSMKFVGMMNWNHSLIDRFIQHWNEKHG